MIRKEDWGHFPLHPHLNLSPGPHLGHCPTWIGWMKGWVDNDQMLDPASPSISNSLGCGSPTATPGPSPSLHFPRPRTFLVVKVMPSVPHVKLSSSHQQWLHLNLTLISMNNNAEAGDKVGHDSAVFRYPEAAATIRAEEMQVPVQDAQLNLHPLQQEGVCRGGGKHLSTSLLRFLKTDGLPKVPRALLFDLPKLVHHDF